MADELPEWPADAPVEGEEPIDTETSLCDRVADFLHRALNDKPVDLGPQVVTRWVVVAEVQGIEREKPTLRWLDSDLSPWDRTGMLTQVLEDEKEQRMLFSIASMASDDDDEENA